MPETIKHAYRKALQNQSSQNVGVEDAPPAPSVTWNIIYDRSDSANPSDASWSSGLSGHVVPCEDWASELDGQAVFDTLLTHIRKSERTRGGHPDDAVAASFTVINPQTMEVMACVVMSKALARPEFLNRALPEYAQVEPISSEAVDKTPLLRWAVKIRAEDHDQFLAAVDCVKTVAHVFMGAADVDLGARLDARRDAKIQRASVSVHRVGLGGRGR